MKLVLIVMALLWPTLALAQGLPAQFAVTGVAADDVLNIRAAPDAGAPVLSSYAPNASHIEVLEVTADGTWGLVGLPEGNGWVAMRFLARQTLVPGTIPRPLHCLGTEPFWSLHLGDTYQSFVTPEGAEPLLLTSWAVAADGYLATLAGHDDVTLTMIVRAARCSDGMSDRTFGWQTLIWRGAADNTLLSGCCTLDDH